MEIDENLFQVKVTEGSQCVTIEKVLQGTIWVEFIRLYSGRKMVVREQPDPFHRLLIVSNNEEHKVTAFPKDVLQCMGFFQQRKRTIERERIKSRSLLQ